MKIKASGCSALILATGLFACFAAPLPATAASANSATAASKSDTVTSANSTKQSSRHSKRDAHGKSGTEKSSETSSDTKKAADTGATDAGGPAPSAIPASVANANAQLTAEASADSASAMSAKANTLLAGADGQPSADGQVVSSDQLNDVDRALQQSQPATPGAPATQTVAMAPIRAASASPALASSNDSSTWDQTSLIGKIFIGFGALLTMASAARMFMA
jgi:hypothetical protein